MNNDLQSARDLLEELTEAYRALPRPMQARVAALLLRSIPLEPSNLELAS